MAAWYAVHCLGNGVLFGEIIFDNVRRMSARNPRDGGRSIIADNNNDIARIVKLAWRAHCENGLFEEI